MQKDQNLQLTCLECQHPVGFCLSEKHPIDLLCTNCGTVYELRDKTLLHHLQLFDSLCRQIQDSKEILSYTEVGIRIGSQEVKIPYRLLLSRLNPSLKLQLDGVPIHITFLIEPGI